MTYEEYWEDSVNKCLEIINNHDHSSGIKYNDAGKLTKRKDCEFIGQSYDTSNYNFCHHSWKNYQGFTENYYYCEKCDTKR